MFGVGQQASPERKLEPNHLSVSPPVPLGRINLDSSVSATPPNPLGAQPAGAVLPRILCTYFGRNAGPAVRPRLIAQTCEQISSNRVPGTHHPGSLRLGKLLQSGTSRKHRKQRSPSSRRSLSFPLQLVIHLKHQTSQRANLL